MTTQLRDDRQRVLDSVVTALRGVLDQADIPATEHTRLFDELGLDSTSVLELLMGLEDALGVEFDPDSLEQSHFETVGSLTDYILTQST